MKKITLLLLILCLPSTGVCIEFAQLKQVFQKRCVAPLRKECNISLFKGETAEQEVLICCHGYGGDYSFAKKLHQSKSIDAHLISFNFPDFGTAARSKNPTDLVYGSIQELFPLLYIMKECVLSAQIDKLNLYGFSAGGAAVVNAISVLNSRRFARELASLGIGHTERQQILNAMQKGQIILDCPLKSIEEIIADQGLTKQLAWAKKQYKKNKFRPIKQLKSLKNLSLNVLLHFQTPDEVLTNRDDAKYIKKLRKANCHGTTTVVIGTEGKHKLFLPSLEKVYKEVALMR